MIRQKDVDKIIETGRLYVPDEGPFPQYLTMKDFFRAYQMPDLSGMVGEFSEEQKQFLRDHGLDI